MWLLATNRYPFTSDSLPNPTEKNFRMTIFTQIYLTLLRSSLRYLFDRTLIDVAMNRGRDCTLFKSGFFEGHRNARCPHPGRFGELITDFMSSHSKKPAILKFDAMPMEAPVKNLVFMRANFKKDANLDASILFLSLVTIYQFRLCINLFSTCSLRIKSFSHKMPLILPKFA